MLRDFAVAAVVVVCLSICSLFAFADDAAAPPAGAVVLFDGKDTSHWLGKDNQPCPWKVIDGALQAGGGDIHTKDGYLDYTLHIEFRTPTPAEGDKGQHRGNSGIYLDNLYEIQVLESFGIEPPTKGDCAAIYNQKAPDVNAAKGPMEWQTYDITFRAPRFDDAGKKTENARVTVIWNGKKAHDNAEITGPTRSKNEKEIPGPQPIRLQDHGFAVQFRNIYLVPASAND